MTRRKQSSSSFGLLALLVSILLGGFAGYMTGLRAGRPRASMAVAGALLGGFVGFVVLLQFLQLSKPAKRLGGAAAGVLAALACGAVMSWTIPTMACTALGAGLLGLLGDKWAKSINI